MSCTLRGLGVPAAGTWRTRGAALLVVVVVVLWGWTSPAGAHASFDSSDPVAGSTVDGPLTEIGLTFSAAADPVEQEFQVESAAVGTVPIESVTGGGSDVLVVTLSEPAPAGLLVVTWAIRASDTHSVTGTVSFTVASADVTAGDAATLGEGAEAPTAAAGGSVAEAASATSTTSSSTRTLADHLASIARWLVYAAAFVCVGGLAYLAFVHRGTVGECRRLVFVVRRAAVIVLVASVAEWLAQVVAYAQGSRWTVVDPGAWGDLAGTGFGRGTALRLAGAALVLVFVRTDVESWDLDGWELDHRSDDDVADLVLGRTDGRGGGGVAVATAPVRPLARARVEASAGAVVGAVLLVVSEAFIGHTATVTPRLAVLVSDVGHMVAAAAWSSGALMLAVTLRARRRRGQPLDARLLATRFSVMATWCLGLVAVTGLVLAWSILGGLSGLWATEFGRTLLVKLVLVGALVGVGGYNHLVLVPGLEADDPAVQGRFGRTVAVEVGLFAAILAVTALLVVSSPV